MKVAELLGLDNVGQGFARGAGQIEVSPGVLLQTATLDLPVGSAVMWRVSPDLLACTNHGRHPAVVADIERREGQHLVSFCVGAVTFRRRLDGLTLAIGDPCRLHIPASAVCAWPVSVSRLLSSIQN